MPKQVIQTNNAPKPAGPYSQAVRAGDFVFIAGQGPGDPTTRKLVGDTIEEQTRQTMQNVRAVLEAAGATMDDVVKSTVHLANLDDFAAFNEVYATFFPNTKPVRTTVGSALLGIMVEVDVVAYLGD